MNNTQKEITQLKKELQDPKRSQKKKKKNSNLYWLVLIVGIIILLIIIIFSKSNKEEKTRQVSSAPNPPNQEEPDDCPYNEERLTKKNSSDEGVRMVMSDEGLAKWKKIPRDFIVKLWKKGYHWVDIIQLWEWKLEEKEVPDLKAEKRIGVINRLGGHFQFHS